jgi:hypothetical protein
MERGHLWVPLDDKMIPRASRRNAARCQFSCRPRRHLEHTEKSAAGVDEATSADMHGAINLHPQSEKQDAPTIFFPVRRWPVPTASFRKYICPMYKPWKSSTRIYGTQYKKRRQLSKYIYSLSWQFRSPPVRVQHRPKVLCSRRE